MLPENGLQHGIEPNEPTADVRAVELEGQDGIVPGNAAGKAHEDLPKTGPPDRGLGAGCNPPLARHAAVAARHAPG